MDVTGLKCVASLDPDRYNLANLFYEAVGDDPAGKVVVLASNGYTDTSMGGGTKLLRLQEHGCAGVLTDGRLRDFDERARYDFAAYCSGEATRFVFADSSGAIVLPEHQIEEVLEEARKQGRGRRRRRSRGDRPREDS
jgi:4-hydroxy-4-methyl-2-oxoglutarate aldolase